MELEEANLESPFIDQIPPFTSNSSSENLGVSCSSTSLDLFTNYEHLLGYKEQSVFKKKSTLSNSDNSMEPPKINYGSTENDTTIRNSTARLSQHQLSSINARISANQSRNSKVSKKGLSINNLASKSYDSFK